MLYNVSIMSNAKQTLNGVTHGLRSRAVLIEGEFPEEYESLREGFWEQYHPVGRLEEELAERAACCLWRLGRLNRLEAEAMEELARQADVKNSSEAQNVMEMESCGYSERTWSIWTARPERSDELLEVIGVRVQALRDGVGRSLGRGLVQDRSAATFLLLRRYEASIERSFFAALARLEAVQGGRKAAGDQGSGCGVQGIRDAGAGRAAEQLGNRAIGPEGEELPDQVGREGPRNLPLGDCRTGVRGTESTSPATTIPTFSDDLRVAGEDKGGGERRKTPGEQRSGSPCDGSLDGGRVQQRTPQCGVRLGKEGVNARPFPPAPRSGDAPSAAAAVLPRFTRADLAVLPKSIVQGLIKLGVPMPDDE
jgi:hypothetical protein